MSILIEDSITDLQYNDTKQRKHGTIFNETAKLARGIHGQHDGVRTYIANDSEYVLSHLYSKTNKKSCLVINFKQLL